MKKRIITGLLMFVVLAGFVALRFVHLLFFDALVLVIALGAVNEMITAYKLNNRSCHKLLVYLYPFASFAGFYFATTPEKAIVYQLCALLLVFIVCIFIELVSHKKIKLAEENGKSSQDLIDNRYLIGNTLTTLKICIYPLLLLLTLFGINHLGLYDGLVGLVMVLGVACFSDIFAYFFGMLLGQKGKSARLCEHISPKKSVVGFVFGCIGGILAGALGLWLFHFAPIFESVFAEIEMLNAVIFFAVIGAVGTLASQFGDLFSSAFKRKVGIKDFGSIFPGHGGFMDRVDSLMFMSALFYLCFICIIL